MMGIPFFELALAGRDLFSALQRTVRHSGGGSGGRMFAWGRHGARVALQVARAINYCHHKVGGASPVGEPQHCDAVHAMSSAAQL